MRLDLILRRIVSSLLRDRRGGVAIMFGLMALPLIGLVGLSIDVGFTVMAKSRMDLAADAAALSAAKTAATAFAAGATGANAITQGQTTGQAWFLAQSGTTNGLTMGVPTLTVAQTGGVFTASLTYSGSMTTTIAQVFGFPVFPVTGASSATITVGGYADIDILMDISSSMGIAATAAGIAQLGPLALASNPTMAQSQNCAFGCHWDAGNNDFYGLARKYNIQLRIDVLISAVQSVVSQLITQNTQALYRIGLFSFDTAFHIIYPVSSNLSSALTAAQNVTVPLANPNNEPDTNYPLAMQTITTTLGVSGNGSTAASPREYLFLVTDGVQDYVNANGQRVVAAMTPDVCNAMKANGVTILVLYTQYIPLPTNAFYVDNVAPFASSIVPNLTACASAPEYYFAATDPSDIQAAMQRMLQLATSTQARFIK